MKKFCLAVIPLSAFILYLHTLGPTIVPYRDAGEMATTVSQLGVLHPPGYPLYSLVGHLFTRVPLANPAYRLNVLSAICLAGTWALLLLLGIELWGLPAAVLTLLLGVVSFQFWAHALVSEMYTLSLVFLSLLLLLMHRRKPEAAVFLFGLGLGARLDLLLCGPALLALFISRTSSEERIRKILWAALFFFMGCSVYLYLWVRAHGHPFLNWGDPSTLERFWASLVRRSYGGSLDLLSKSYQTGENFWPEFRLYLHHLGRDFTLLSLPLALLGFFHTWKTNRPWFLTLLLGWGFTGPLFIYLGNLPINPHAVAIMEASYLMPDVFYLLAIGWGIAWFNGASPRTPLLIGEGTLKNPLPSGEGGPPRFGVVGEARRWGFIAISVLLTILIAAQAIRFYPAVSKRSNWVGADFIHNVYYSVPEPSLITAHSDVPAFLLFYGHWIYPGLKWRVPLAQGLAGSAWYQVMMDEQVPKLDVQPLRTVADWEATLKANPGWSLYGTPDTDWAPELYPRMVPSGLLMEFLPRGKASIMSSDTLLRDLGIYRGRYRYDAYYEFFTPELIEEYAKAWMEWGRLLVQSHQDGDAIEAFLKALSYKPDMPYAAFQLAYIYFSHNDFDHADYYYRWSVDNFHKMHRQAEEWKSFPSVREGIFRDEAQAMAHWGVVQERKGDSERAMALYRKALQVDPQCADARYNLAVIYWRAQRWSDVVEQLQALSVAHPEDPRWRIYLPKALEHLKKGG